MAMMRTPWKLFNADEGKDQIWPLRFANTTSPTSARGRTTIRTRGSSRSCCGICGRRDRSLRRRHPEGSRILKRRRDLGRKLFATVEFAGMFAGSAKEALDAVIRDTGSSLPHLRFPTSSAPSGTFPQATAFPCDEQPLLTNPKSARLKVCANTRPTPQALARFG